MNTYTEAALKMLKWGLTPHPLRGKVPLLKEWQSLKNVTPEQVIAWDSQFENVGVVCGESSGGLVVIDFDGLAAYEQYCRRFPSYLDTLMVATGSGNGMHIYFRSEKLPDSCGFMNIYDAPEADKDAWINIEFKANGKQVVAPPSIHPDTHKAYFVATRLPIRTLPNMEEIIRWAASFKTVENWTPPTIRIGAQDPINPAVKSALESYFTRNGHKMHGDWVNTSCPNSGSHKHGDKHFTFGYNITSAVGNCFSCGTILTKELCELAGIDTAGLGGLFEKPQARAKTAYTPPQVKVQSQSAQPIEVQYVSDVDALKQYADEVNGDAVPVLQPIINPYGFLHRFGGTAHILTPGQLAFFASVSGGTKTIGFETGWTALQTQGINSIVYTPEWVDSRGAMMMAARAVQRAGGITVSDKLAQSLWQIAHANQMNGVYGKPLSSLMVSNALAKVEQLKRLPGRLYYLKNPGLSAERLCAEIETVCDLEAAKGNIIRVAWIDFAQLLWLESGTADGRIWIETAINLIKDTCQRKNLVGFISSQLKKTDAESAKTSGNFDAGMMQWLSEQQCNLLVMFVPKFDGENRIDGKLRARVLKNSLAAIPDEEFEISVDFNRLSWMDSERKTS